MSRVLLLIAFSLLPIGAPGANLPLAIPLQITHAQNFDPSPSPDGKSLVYISVISGKEQLFTMNVDGRNSVKLTRDDTDHEDPSWSPDGTRIVFVQISGGHNRIAVMRVDGTDVQLLTPIEQNTIHPNWSSDSKRIIYCTNDDLQPPKKNTAATMPTINPSAPINARSRIRSPLDYASVSREFAETPGWRQALGQIGVSVVTSYCPSRVSHVFYNFNCE